MRKGNMGQKGQRSGKLPEEQEKRRGRKAVWAGPRELWNRGGCFPPGYERWKWERNGAVFLLGTGAVLSLRFIGRLYRMVKSLYFDTGQERVLREDARELLISFSGLAQGHWRLYVPFFLFLTVMAFGHYAYYFHESKSIYLMRRLPAGGVLAASCLRGPLAGMAAGAAVFGLLELLYYGVYLLAVPGGILP